MGGRIREARTAKGWDQGQLAAGVGLSRPGTISEWENDKATPQLGQLPGLVRALGVRAEWLLGLGGPMYPVKASSLPAYERAFQRIAKLVDQARGLEHVPGHLRPLPPDDDNGLGDGSP